MEMRPFFANCDEVHAKLLQNCVQNDNAFGAAVWRASLKKGKLANLGTCRPRATREKR
jgi:hypothetical protein